MIQPTESELDTQIGVALREARLTQGFTQDELARALGVNRTTIARYESGIRSLSISALLRISHALAVPATVLVPSLQAAEPKADGVVLTNLYSYPADTIRHRVAELPARTSNTDYAAVQTVVRVLEQHPDLVPAVLETLEAQLLYRQHNGEGPPPV